MKNKFSIQAVLIIAFSIMACPFSNAQTPVYKNPKAPVEERTADLLRQLTLDEKLKLIGGDHFSTFAIERLGIPAYKMTDGPMGIRANGKTTAYPGGVALAATWNTGLAERIGVAFGRDCRARGIHILLAPGMNLYRAPMCGRNFEYLGEDPTLAGDMASAFIQGVQSQGVAATAKHLAGNEQEVDRHDLNSAIDERTLRELYLKPFEIAVKNGVRCVMNSYNPLNGIHATQNNWLNNTLLKGDFGFQGVLMSDWQSCYDTLGMTNGGLDLEMPLGKFYEAGALKALLSSGKIKETTIDEKVRRILLLGFSMGWFDRPQQDSSIPLDDPESAKASLDSARESITLLKNERRILPLDRSGIKRIVVLGPNADPAVIGGGGSALVKEPAHVVSALQGLKEKAGGVEIVRVPWLGASKLIPKEFTEAIKGADAAVVCVGFNDSRSLLKNIEAEAQAKPRDSSMIESEGSNRHYELPLNQPELIKAVVALNPKTIVVLNAGGSVATADWVSSVPVLLHAYYPGQEGGTALAEILFGETNPSGKLPFSWEQRWEDCAAFGNYPLSRQQKGSNTYKEGVLLGYRWFDAKGLKPLFPFGFGMSYTRFAYSDLKITPDENTNGLVISATIKNTGEREGEEIAQIYIAPPEIGIVRPVRELKGFAKVRLQPGESKTISIVIPHNSLAYWNPATKAWTVTPGKYSAEVGGSSRWLPLRGEFRM